MPFTLPWVFWGCVFNVFAGYFSLRLYDSSECLVI